MSSPDFTSRLNPSERRILDLLGGVQKPLSAYDVIDALSGEKRLAPPTVYRALQRLMDEGLVHRLESQNAYIACRHHGPAHYAGFMICRACGATREFSGAALESLLGQIARKNGFVAETIALEAQGLCANCQNLTPPDASAA